MSEAEAPLMTMSEAEAPLMTMSEAEAPLMTMSEAEARVMTMSEAEARLMDAAQAEALLGGTPGARVSAFMAQVASAYFADQSQAEAVRTHERPRRTAKARQHERAAPMRRERLIHYH